MTTTFFSSSLHSFFVPRMLSTEQDSPRCTRHISCGPSPTIGTNRRFFLSLPFPSFVIELGEVEAPLPAPPPLLPTPPPSSSPSPPPSAALTSSSVSTSLSLGAARYTPTFFAFFQIGDARMKRAISAPGW